jgi:hypothetical protein
MDEPLTVWYCDRCRKRIEDSEQGRVRWQVSEGKAHNFKIVHIETCMWDPNTASADLSDFLGPDKLPYLLSFLSAGPIVISRKLSPTRVASNVDEFVDFIRRVQTPYYEEARRYFGVDDIFDFVEDDPEITPYLPGQLENIVACYSKDA